MNYTTAERIAVVWPSVFGSAEAAAPYVCRPEKLAKIVYAAKNGNLGGEDGWLFRGSGLIQLTGRENFRRAALAINAPYLDVPSLVREFRSHAAETACWFWADCGLNELADKGDFANIVRRITGTSHGLKGRLELWEKAKKALNVIA